MTRRYEERERYGLGDEVGVEYVLVACTCNGCGKDMLQNLDAVSARFSSTSSRWRSSDECDLDFCATCTPVIEDLLLERCKSTSS